MKRFVRFFTLAAFSGALLIGMNSCDKNNDSTETLEVAPTSLQFDAAGGTKTIDVKSNTTWTATPSATWIEVKTEASTITVTVKANTGDALSGGITVKTSGLEKVVTVTQAGVSENEVPAAAGTITESDLTSTSAKLTIGAIAGAKTYKWYKDGAEVQNTESMTYTATANGTYKVAGVNAAGEGAASPNHVVTLSGGGSLTADDLVGTWTSTSNVFINDVGLFPFENEMYVTKVDDNTIKIEQVFDFKGMYEYLEASSPWEDPVSCETITATINSNGTISIPWQSIPMFGYVANAGATAMYFGSYHVNGNAQANWNKGFENLPVNNFSIDLSGSVQPLTLDGVPTDNFASYWILAQIGGSYYYIEAMFMDTVWTKNTSNPAPKKTSVTSIQSNVELNPTVASFVR